MRRLPLLLLLAALLVPASASAVEVGINDSQLYQPGQALEAPLLAGAWVREFVSWPEIEPAPGVYNQSLLKAYAASVQGLQARGRKVLIDLVNTPTWESGSAATNAPPDPTAYAEFARYFASFPGIAGNVGAYEIWNEEDAPLWWAGAPDAGAYTQLLKAAYPALKAAAPSASVLVGGLTGNDYNFLQELYNDGARGYFDAVAVHTDTACLTSPPTEAEKEANGRISRWSFTGYREVHQTMAANGDDDKLVWITELGWSTDTSSCESGESEGKKPGGVSEAAQATYLSEAYSCVAADPYVAVAVWFNLQDGAGGQDNTFGLYHEDGSPKPSLASYLAAAHGITSDPSCGLPAETAPPSINLVKPRPSESFSANLPIRFTSADNQVVVTAHLYEDGHLIRNFSTSSPSTHLTGAINWQGAKLLPPGRHVITLTTTDKAGRKVSTSVIVYKRKVAPRPTRITLTHSHQVIHASVVGETGGVAAGRLIVYVRPYHGRIHRYQAHVSSFSLRLHSGVYRVWAVFTGNIAGKPSRSPVVVMRLR